MIMFVLGLTSMSKICSVENAVTVTMDIVKGAIGCRMLTHL